MGGVQQSEREPIMHDNGVSKHKNMHQRDLTEYNKKEVCKQSKGIRNLPLGMGCNNVEENDYAWEGCKQSTRRLCIQRGVTNSKQHNTMHWMVQNRLCM